MPVEAASPAQISQLQSALVQLESQMQGATALAVARRYAFFSALSNVPPALAQAAASMFPDVIAANAAADNDARGYAMLLAALKRGDVVIVPWVVQSEGGQPGAIQLGIARAGDNNLGQWALLPIIVRVAVQVVAGVGAWVIANAWTHARELEANADQVRANTQAKITAAVAALASTNPQGATALADALTRANNAASGAQPGLLDTLAQGAQRVATGLGEGLSSGLLWAALAWFFFRRKST